MLLAVVCAALSLCVFAASSAGAAVRTEFFGIAQGQLDAQDRQGMAAARIQTARFMLKWRDIEKSAGLLRLERTGPLHRRPGLAGNPSGPVRVGVAEVGGQRATEHPPIDSAAEMQAWRNFLKAAVARYGPGGTYWAPGHTDQHYGASATPLPIKSWQIWNEPNLRKFFDPGVDDLSRRPRSTRGCSRSPTTRSRPRIRRPRSSSPACRLPARGRSSNAWDFLNASTTWPGSRPTSTPPPCTPTRATWIDVRHGDPAVPRRDGEPRRRGDAAVDHRVRLGIGAARPLRHQQGRRRASATGCSSSFKLILQQPNAWNVQRLFWFLWRDPTPVGFATAAASAAARGC